ncbi:MAG: hypothetical protein KKF56_04875 [Nanoarchaeota archaeon]|nr:hypothetical protein [Nanoarchaeota archaeon]
MKIVFTPDWFLSPDVIIEVFSFVILFLFFIFSYKNYKLNKNKNSLYLGIGFLLIALAELATILTKLILYYDTSFTQTVGQIIVTYQAVQSVDIFYYVGFFWHKLLTLAGFFMIYRLPFKKTFAGDFIFGVYFLLISALFSVGFYYLFHLTALILLILIIGNYYEVYKKNKSDNTKLLISALSLLAFSQVIFILSKFVVFYAIAQVIQLVSYILLLVLIIRILQHGKSYKGFLGKKKNGKK